MGTNKNKRASATRSRKAKAAEEEASTINGPQQEQPQPKKFNGFSWAQLTGLIYLGIAISWLVSYGKVAFRDGVSSSACSQYVKNVESCSTVDIKMSQMKYFSGMLTTTMSALAMLVCWFDEAIFLRLITMFCFSPLITTVLALQATGEWMKPAQMAHIGFHTTVYLVFGAGSIAYSPDVSPMRLPRLNLKSLTLVTLIIAQAYEIIKLGMEGVAGLINVPGGASDVTDPATVLIYFLCVDRATLIGILVLALLYVDDTRQRKLLLFYGFSHFVSVAIQIPKMEGFLLDPEYQRNLAFGSGMFSLTAWVAPDMNLFGSSKTDGGGDSAASTPTSTTEETSSTTQSKQSKKKKNK